MLNIGHRLLSEILGTLVMNKAYHMVSEVRLSVGPTLITLFALPQEAEHHLHSVFILLKQILTAALYFEKGRVDGITALPVKRDMLVVGFKYVDFAQQVTQQCLPGNTVALLIKPERRS